MTRLHGSGLVSPSGMVETPRLQAKRRLTGIACDGVAHGRALFGAQGSCTQGDHCQQGRTQPRRAWRYGDGGSAATLFRGRTNPRSRAANRKSRLPVDRFRTPRLTGEGRSVDISLEAVRKPTIFGGLRAVAAGCPSDADGAVPSTGRKNGLFAQSPRFSHPGPVSIAGWGTRVAP